MTPPRPDDIRIPEHCVQAPLAEHICSECGHFGDYVHTEALTRSDLSMRDEPPTAVPFDVYQCRNTDCATHHGDGLRGLFRVVRHHERVQPRLRSMSQSVWEEVREESEEWYEALKEEYEAYGQQVPELEDTPKK